MENLTFKKKAKQTFGEFMNINNIVALLFFLNCSPLKILLLIFHSRDFSAMWCEPTVIERLRIPGS